MFLSHQPATGAENHRAVKASRLQTGRQVYTEVGTLLRFVS